ncbi:anti-sigma factor family protein [Gordonia insulae]|nr:hypothetical protein [Gordonia insulae]
MIPPGADDPENAASRYPQPPYPVDLLADLHAGVLPPDVADHIRAHLADDPQAQSVLDALDRTVAQLSGAPVASVPVPSAVVARTAQTLDSIRSEVSSTGDGTVAALPTPSDRARRNRWFAAGGIAAAAAVVAAVAISISVVRTPSTDPPVQAQPSASGTIGDLAPGERVALLSVLGRNDVAPFPSEAALRRCLAANGVAADTVILGTGPVTVRDRQAVVILLGTGVAGRFDALVVGPDCATGNPATISRSLIGG